MQRVGRGVSANGERPGLDPVGRIDRLLPLNALSSSTRLADALEEHFESSAAPLHGGSLFVHFLSDFACNGSLPCALALDVPYAS